MPPEPTESRTILWVYAHPEERSLNASLRDAGVAAAQEAGHRVVLSDLYAMGWKSELDGADVAGTPDLPPEISRATRRAYDAGTLAPDIREEQRKLRDADALVLQFPLWWYATPAILKGWIDRVFAKGFAYGLRDPRQPGRTFRYGDGPLAGRRAQVITTTGSPAPAMGPRGINGQLDQVLFPLLHGTLWYVGIAPLPPLAVHSADRFDRSDFREASSRIAERMHGLFDVEPIGYRYQNRDDYDDDLVLRDDVAPGATGLSAHQEPEQEDRRRPEPPARPHVPELSRT